jgi:hypothetical protein
MSDGLSIPFLSRTFPKTISFDSVSDEHDWMQYFSSDAVRPPGALSLPDESEATGNHGLIADDVGTVPAIPSHLSHSPVTQPTFSDNGNKDLCVWS